MFNRIYYLIVISFVIASVLRADVKQDEPFLFFTKQQIEDVKKRVSENDPAIESYAKQLKKVANKFMKKDPWTVTDYISPAVSGNPHDYFSESPYWWPNPEDPDGPYIRKDGIRNPDRFMEHKDALKNMVQAVSVLSMAAYFFDNERFADRAVHLLRVWFLDEKTKMNPHLNYAQAIRNKSPGRGVGIIDTHRFIYLIEFLNLLKETGQWKTTEQAALQNWFKEYLFWLTHSKNGLQEKNQGNNHTTYWCAQTAACAFFVDDVSSRDSVWHYVKNSVLDAQLEADGSMPEELARTKSFSYCIFNLNAFSLLSTIAQHDGEMLWTHKNNKGSSISKAVRFMVPFIKEPDSWTYEQIVPYEKDAPYLLYFSGRALNDPEILGLYRANHDKTDMSGYSKDIFTFLINMIVTVDSNKSKQ